MNTNTTLLRHALLRSTVPQLGEVIDWLDRPWAAGKNDALRAAWHEARRSDGARRALGYALEEEIRSLSDRDAAHVAGRLAVAASTADGVATEIAQRLGVPSWPLPVSPEVLAAALRATADLARIVLGTPGGDRHGRHHHHPRGRRYGHGR
jgi:hypothetical protein